MEIKVNKSSLQASEKALGVLAARVKNRKLAAPITKSKGALATEVKAAGEQLELIGSALHLLISNTERAVRNTWVEFETVDMSMANHFGMKEGGK